MISCNSRHEIYFISACIAFVAFEKDDSLVNKIIFPYASLLSHKFLVNSTNNPNETFPPAITKTR